VVAEKKRILVIDDNADIRDLIQYIFEKAGKLVIQGEDGVKGLAKVKSQRPDLILLDTTMPGISGLDVLTAIRKDRNSEISAIPVVMLTANHLRTKKGNGSEKPTVLKASDMTLDLLTRELRVGEKLVPITRTEFDFIHLLMEEPNRVFTRAQVSHAIGISAEFTSDHLLDTHASRLRIKILNAGGPRAISAVRAVGYRLI